MNGPGKEYLWVAVVEEEDGWNLHLVSHCQVACQEHSHIQAASNYASNNNMHMFYHFVIKSSHFDPFLRRSFSLFVRLCLSSFGYRVRPMRAIDLRNK